MLQPYHFHLILSSLYWVPVWWKVPCGEMYPWQRCCAGGKCPRSSSVTACINWMYTPAKSTNWTAKFHISWLTSLTVWNSLPSVLQVISASHWTHLGGTWKLIFFESDEHHQVPHWGNSVTIYKCHDLLTYLLVLLLVVKQSTLHRAATCHCVYCRWILSYSLSSLLLPLPLPSPFFSCTVLQHHSPGAHIAPTSLQGRYQAFLFLGQFALYGTSEVSWPRNFHTLETGTFTPKHFCILELSFHDSDTNRELEMSVFWRLLCIIKAERR